MVLRVSVTLVKPEADVHSSDQGGEVICLPLLSNFHVVCVLISSCTTCDILSDQKQILLPLKEPNTKFRGEKTDLVLNAFMILQNLSDFMFLH